MVQDNSKKALGDMLGRVNVFKTSGLTFSIGQEINPSYQDVVSVLRGLWVGGFTHKYKLVQTHIPHELLFTGSTKETNLALVPQIVRNAEWAVETNQLDVLDPENYRLVVGVYVLSWYWFHTLGGPKPDVRGLKDREVRKIIQNEPLCCPICYKKYTPPSHLVTQSAKAWAWLEWLPTHFVGYHFWSVPQRMKVWVKKEAFKALEEHLVLMKKRSTK
jgi:hypothetical protein